MRRRVARWTCMVAIGGACLVVGVVGAAMVAVDTLIMEA